MATLTELYDFSLDTVFQGQVRAAVTKAAMDIAGEDITGQSVQKKLKRQTLAYDMLRNFNNVQTWALAVASNIDSIAPNETQINNAVSAIWDDMAGVQTGE